MCSVCRPDVLGINLVNLICIRVLLLNNAQLVCSQCAWCCPARTAAVYRNMITCTMLWRYGVLSPVYFNIFWIISKAAFSFSAYVLFETFSSVFILVLNIMLSELLMCWHSFIVHNTSVVSCVVLYVILIGYIGQILNLIFCRMALICLLYRILDLNPVWFMYFFTIFTCCWCCLHVGLFVSIILMSCIKGFNLLKPSGS